MRPYCSIIICGAKQMALLENRMSRPINKRDKVNKTKRSLFIRASLLGAAFTMLTACNQPSDPSKSGKPTFFSTDITGGDFAKTFALTDHNNQARSMQDFRGKAVIVFFGFLNCPDICPTAMADWANVLTKLGPEAAKNVQVLFVTVDPERDKPDALKNYVTAFNPSYLGLWGDAIATAATAKAFKVIYAKVRGEKEGSYSMDHTAASYVFDGNGNMRLYVRHAQPIEQLVSDIQNVLKYPLP